MRPLDGFRVLDFTQNVAGPLAGQVLADLGAEVIKIEAPAGEASRRITSTKPGLEHLQPYFLPNNRGKKSVVLDLTTEDGVRDALTLVDSADVLLEGFRPGVMTRLGLGPDAVRTRNPRCVYASLSAYGDSGRPGIDLTVQAESGCLTGLQDADGSPMFINFQLIDGASGHVFAQAVLAALLHRERHGAATQVNVAMYDVACSLQSNHLTHRLNGESTKKRAPGRPVVKGVAVEPSGAYRAADGHLVLAAYVPKHWQALTTLLGRADLAADPRFADQRSRTVHSVELRAELEKEFAARTVDDWTALLQAAGLMAVRANTWSDVVRSPVFADSGLTVETECDGRTVTTLRTPARYSDFDAVATGPVPGLGEHTGTVR